MKNLEQKAIIRKLQPEDGMWLTEKQAPEFIEQTIFSKEVYLATNDDATRWKEITDAEKLAIEAEIKKVIEEREKKVKENNK